MVNTLQGNTRKFEVRIIYNKITGGYKMNKTVLRTSLVMMATIALIFSKERIDTGHTTALKTVNNQQISQISTSPDNGATTSIDRDEIIIYSDDFEGEGEAWGTGHRKI